MHRAQQCSRDITSVLMAEGPLGLCMALNWRTNGKRSVLMTTQAEGRNLHVVRLQVGDACSPVQVHNGGQVSTRHRPRHAPPQRLQAQSQQHLAASMPGQHCPVTPPLPHPGVPQPSSSPSSPQPPLHKTIAALPPRIRRSVRRPKPRSARPSARPQAHRVAGSRARRAVGAPGAMAIVTVAGGGRGGGRREGEGAGGRREGGGAARARCGVEGLSAPARAPLPPPPKTHRHTLSAPLPMPTLGHPPPVRCTL